jgi:hypothetical protein
VIRTEGPVSSQLNTPLGSELNIFMTARNENIAPGGGVRGGA